MLKTLRKKGVAKKILWFVAIIIVISFGFFGTANYLNYNKGTNFAGRIFGKMISLDQFQKNYMYTRNQAILRYGENFYKISPFLQLETETWDRLILLHEAQKRRIKVSDQEVINTIAQFPLFQREGQFDPLLYNDLLRYVFKCQPREFEEGIRGSIMFNKLFEQEVPPQTLNDDQLWNAYQKENVKIQVSYILFAPEDYKNEVIITEQEAEEYFSNHSEDFLMPSSINVEFINIDYPENATKEQKKEIDSKVGIIAQGFKNNPDFEEVAKNHNLSVQETGFFSLERADIKISWPFEVLKKAFDLELNQISEPLETHSGYSILKCKGKQTSHVPDFPTAKDQVKDVLILKKASEVAKSKAQSYLQEIKNGINSDPSKNFSDLAQSLNLTAQKTDLFNRGQYIPNIGIAKDFQDLAFSLNEQNKLGGPVATPKGFCLLFFESIVETSTEAFEKDKNQFRTRIMEEIKNEFFNEFMASLRLKANLEDNIAKLIDKNQN